MNYVACNLKKTGDLSAQEIMHKNYICRLKKIILDPNYEGQSAGGAKYVFPSYSEGVKKRPAMSNGSNYNTVDNVYKNYDIQPCSL
jgi:hypothetical protein